MSPGARLSGAALIGIGCRLPSDQDQDLRGPSQLWDFLLTGNSAATVYPDHRWKRMLELMHPEDRTEQPWPVAHIDLPEHTDHSALGLREQDVQVLSSTQRLVLEVGLEAVADAGVRATDLSGPGTGIYVGNASPDEALTTFHPGTRPHLVHLSAGGAGMIGTPLSRYLNSRGPVVTHDTTCSASLHALDAARQDLATGRVDTAVVFGTSVLTQPTVSRAFGVQGGVLAHDGVCRPFDADASGYVRGEAVVAVVLRAPDLARVRQDRVYALLEHTEIGADGRSAGVGMPNASAQAELLTRTYRRAEVPTGQVGYVLGHGTGTQGGDRAEIKAIGQVFDRTEQEPLWVGSIKGALGHSEGASALTSVAAAALALHHGQIPPTVGHHRPDAWLSDLGLRVPVKPEPWPEDIPRRIGISSFGFSGALGHIVLGGSDSEPAPEESATGTAVALPVSAHSPAHLEATAHVLGQALSSHAPPVLGRLAAHTQQRRDHRPHRAAVVATDTDQAVEAFTALSQGEVHPALVGPRRVEGRPRVVWAFGGLGSAYAQMGRQLYTTDPEFAGLLDQVRQAMSGQPGVRPWHPATTPVEGIAAEQQATFAMQVVTAQLLTRRWGMAPDVVVGHSLGEVAAAHISGALPLTEAARLVCARSLVLERAQGQGTMAAVSLPAPEVDQLADQHGLEVAAYNAPERAVLTGSQQAVAQMLHGLAEQGVHARPMDGAPPAHSVSVQPHLDEMAADLGGQVRSQPGQVEMVSTVTGAPVDGDSLGLDYWLGQLRAPVRFEQALVRAEMGSTGPCLIVEISPAPVLSVLAGEIRARHHLPLDVVCVGDREDEGAGMVRAAATAYTHGAHMSWPSNLDRPVDLAPVPWHASASAHVPLAQQLAGRAHAERVDTVVNLVHRLVADLAPVPVRVDQRDTKFERLGLNSLDVHTLRTSLLAQVENPPAELPDHVPTIHSVANVVVDIVDAQQ